MSKFAVGRLIKDRISGPSMGVYQRAVDRIKSESTLKMPIGILGKFDPNEPRDSSGRWTNAGFPTASEHSALEDSDDTYDWLARNLTSLEEDEYGNMVNLTEEQERAITQYAYRDYIDTNQSLRDGGSLADDPNGIAEELQNVIKENTLEEPITVFRSGFPIPNVKVGDVIQDRGFVSTYYDFDTSNWFRKGSSDVQIQLPAGTNCVHGNLSENEIILGAGSKFEVVSVGDSVVLRYLGNKSLLRKQKINQVKSSVGSKYVWMPGDITHHPSSKSNRTSVGTLTKYSPDQPRDSHGRFTSVGGTATSTADKHGAHIEEQTAKFVAAGGHIEHYDLLDMTPKEQTALMRSLTKELKSQGDLRTADEPKQLDDRRYMSKVIMDRALMYVGNKTSWMGEPARKSVEMFPHLFVMRDGDNKISGLACWSIGGIFNNKPYVYLDYFASTGRTPGTGSAAFGKVVDAAARNGWEIHGEPASGAITFWQGVGADYKPTSLSNGEWISWNVDKLKSMQKELKTDVPYEKKTTNPDATKSLKTRFDINGPGGEIAYDDLPHTGTYLAPDNPDAVLVSNKSVTAIGKYGQPIDKGVEKKLTAIGIAVTKFDPTEARDARGRWTRDGSAEPSDNTVSFKDWNDAEKWFEDRNIELNVYHIMSYGGKPSDMARVANQITTIQTKFPGSLSTLKYITAEMPRAETVLASVNTDTGDSTLKLTPKFFKMSQNPDVMDQAIQERIEETGKKLNVATTPDDIITHELGHVLDKETNSQFATDNSNMIAWMGTWFNHENDKDALYSRRNSNDNYVISIFEQAAYRTGWLRKDGLPNQLLAKDVSPYARKNPAEMSAEIFSLFQQPDRFAELPKNAQKRLLAYQGYLNDLAGAQILKFEEPNVPMETETNCTFGFTQKFWDIFFKLLDEKKGVQKFDPNQPRDEHGRWTKVDSGSKEPTFDINQVHILGADHIMGPIKPYLVENGKYYEGRERPSSIYRGVPNECFKNATILVMEDQLDGEGHLQYCEGVAFNNLADLPFAILHGWAVDENGNVIDNTLDDPENWSYFGVTYPWDEYQNYLSMTGYYGVLGGNGEDAETVLTFNGIE
jgi:ADP-ribosyltransferase exoenzyme